MIICFHDTSRLTSDAESAYYALLWTQTAYKRAEAAADTDDYRNLAQVNYRIGQLMSNYNATNQEDLR